jgi:uncharacterized membrane protein
MKPIFNTTSSSQTFKKIKVVKVIMLFAFQFVISSVVSTKSITIGKTLLTASDYIIGRALVSFDGSKNENIIFQSALIFFF